MAMRAFNGLGLAADPDAVQELKDGWFNASYKICLADGRFVVLKIAPPKDAEIMLYEHNIMATEVATMRLVGQNPVISVPEIYYFDITHDLCDADYFFMEHMPGECLEHIKDSLTPAAKTAIDRHIGAIIRAINNYTGPYFGYDGNPDLRADTWKEAFNKIIESLLEDAARKDVVFDYSYDELRAVVLKHAPALEEVTTPRLVHWDTWSPNFFVRANQITGIIDFERALWADPLMEAQFRQFGDGGVTDSMRGYGKTTFTFVEEQRMHLYSLHLALVMFIESFYRHYDTDDILNFSRQYMAENMAWLKTH